MTETTTRRRIVVGVDGSDGSRTALEWAMDEAALRGVDLDAVAAWSLPVISDGFGGVYPLPEQYNQAEADAKALVEAEIEAVRSRQPGVTVNAVVLSGQASDALLAASKDADLLVVGSRGRRSLSRAILGSVSRTLMQDSPRPVAVVHKPSRKHAASSE